MIYSINPISGKVDLSFINHQMVVYVKQGGFIFYVFKQTIKAFQLKSNGLLKIEPIYPD